MYYTDTVKKLYICIYTFTYICLCFLFEKNTTLLFLVQTFFQQKQQRFLQRMVYIDQTDVYDITNASRFFTRLVTTLVGEATLKTNALFLFFFFWIFYGFYYGKVQIFPQFGETFFFFFQAPSANRSMAMEKQIVDEINNHFLSKDCESSS